MYKENWENINRLPTFLFSLPTDRILIELIKYRDFDNTERQFAISIIFLCLKYYNEVTIAVYHRYE